ncbi:MAG: purine-nucleoside phosphorylase, partial [Chlorobi bacterium]|nr:purine-nucleoside phosphorylase [Chlorobiota bacterium]
MKTAIRSPRFDDEAIEYLSGEIGEFKPKVGIILGTGLGGLVNDVSIKYKIDYRQIPHFPVPTVESHHGYLIFGEISGKSVVIMQGRFHYYEGYTHEEVTFPVRVMKRLGVNYLLVSNACGGMNPLFKRADLMLMQDHINFHFDTPLKNFALKTYNKTIYDRELISLAEKIALENQINIRKAQLVEQGAVADVEGAGG